MNCREFQDYITPAVDRQIDGTKKQEFDNHATACPPCRKNFESEARVKSAVVSHCRRANTPPELTRHLQSLIASEPGPVQASKRWRSMIDGFWFRPAIVLVISCVAVILVVRRSSPVPDHFNEAAVGNVIDQSLANFHAVVNGVIKPQLASSDRKDIEGFFSGKTGFNVMVPSMKSCTLVGGVMNDYAGIPLAHVMYQRDGKVIYMYETCWETVQKGERLMVPVEAKESLSRTGWYTTRRDDGDVIVLWTKGPTLCAAVANMSEGDLMACLLSEAESTTASPW